MAKLHALVNCSTGAVAVVDDPAIVTLSDAEAQAQAAERAAEVAATEQDHAALRAAVGQALADLDQIKRTHADVAVRRLAAIQIRMLRQLARQAGASVPGEE